MFKLSSNDLIKFKQYVDYCEFLMQRECDGNSTFYPYQSHEIDFNALNKFFRDQKIELNLDNIEHQSLLALALKLKNADDKWGELTPAKKLTLAGLLQASHEIQNGQLAIDNMFLKCYSMGIDIASLFTPTLLVHNSFCKFKLA